MTAKNIFVRVLSFAIRSFLRIRRRIQLAKYDDFTIAEYFRRQGAIIGEHNRIEIRSLGTEPFLINIGNHCTIAPNVTFLTHDGGTWLFTDEIPSLQKFYPIKVFDNCFIGMSVTIVGHISIGPNSIVGAGAVVTKDVPPNTIVAGNPARVISSVEDYKRRIVNSWSQQTPGDSYFRGFKPGTRYSPREIQNAKIRDLRLLRKHLVRLFGIGMK